MRADAGVVISASHNPFQDNGIKFFAKTGFKLLDEVEERMERLIFNGEIDHFRPTATEIGKAFRVGDARGRYIVFLKNSFPKHLTLDGLKIAVDCAHGAAYRVAPETLQELGAEVFPLGIEPNGENINQRCGALFPQAVQDEVVKRGLDLGVALDGDGDRAILVDSQGRVVDGDQTLALLGSTMIAKGTLNQNTVVATVMSNHGLDLALERVQGRVLRTAVGDRYVVDEMLRGGFNLGGEQSGHIVMLDHSTTGDGILTLLQVLAIMVEKGRSLCELCKPFHRFPQVLVNVEVNEKRPFESIVGLQERISTAGEELKGRGRVLIRYSGTEALARVMVEGEDEKRNREIAEEIAEIFRRSSKGLAE
jgi:phosphoglucosamine mutase